ncbi:MAG: hypothetical protein Q4F84_08180 [Fibrobacter sp.]|nr:hypothetical protein [Fibrobacter sp.]
MIQDNDEVYNVFTKVVPDEDMLLCVDDFGRRNVDLVALKQKIVANSVILELLTIEIDKLMER